MIQKFDTKKKVLEYSSFLEYVYIYSPDWIDFR